LRSEWWGEGGPPTHPLTHSHLQFQSPALARAQGVTVANWWWQTEVTPPHHQSRRANRVACILLLNASQSPCSSILRGVQSIIFKILERLNPALTLIEIRSLPCGWTTLNCIWLLPPQGPKSPQREGLSEGGRTPRSRRGGGATLCIARVNARRLLHMHATGRAKRAGATADGGAQEDSQAVPWRAP
jgi:hypothetical protein